MTDKVQKIREGIEKLKSNLIHGACASQVAMENRCKEEAYNEVLALLDSMQEEPVSNSDWLTELQEKLDNATPEQLEELWNKYNGVDEEEPVSEDIDKAAFDYMETKLDEVKDRKMFLSNFFGSDVENAFKDGAQRQKIKDSEEIKLIRGLLEDFDKHCDEYHEAGFKHGQEAMMKDATDVTVHVDAGGYPYIPQMELYDYDKDIPLAKVGDKVKLIVIKEDSV